MRRAAGMIGLACALVAHVGIGPETARAALYSQSFDANDTVNWQVNNNGVGTNAANFFFDYSTVGIPAAPNSTGGTTRGLKLGANVGAAPGGAGANPGISVSPLGKSFTGNYEVKFDWWSNYVGPLGASPATSTQLSTFGILSSGNVANYDGSVDGLMFGATGNGGVPDGPNDGDYGAYAPERVDGYRWPIANPIVDHALYVGGSRDNANAYYTDSFPGGQAAPAAQQAAFGALQGGVTPAGTPSFAWHEVEIEKIGNNVLWKVDGVLLVYIDIGTFTKATGGNNIFFGHSDIDRTTSTNANFATLEFSLIDNVQVLSLAGDYNQDGNIDEADFTVWKEHYGENAFAQADGNKDGKVDGLDYTMWRNTLTPGAGLTLDGVGTHIPEPAAIVLAACACGVALVSMRRRS